MANWIQSLAPPSINEDKKGFTHRNIAFAGGLGELFTWSPDGISEAINDSNFELMCFWKVMSDEDLFKDFYRRVICIPFCDEIFFKNQEYLKWSKKHGMEIDTVDMAIAIYVVYRMSRQGLGKEFATPTTRIRRRLNENVSAFLSSIDYLYDCHERLIRVECRNMDFRQFIPKYDHKKALTYCDPTYWSNERYGTTEYGEHEMTFEDHVDLLEILRNIEGKFMLSGYHSDLYDNWAKKNGYSCHEKKLPNSASSKKSKELKTECIWTNY